MAEQNENSGSDENVITCLTDDVLLLLAKHYFNGRDCVYLSLSGAFERFAHLFGNNREKLVISQCYFLCLNPWKNFFQQHISPPVLTVFDVSHCYWLRTEDISCWITQMSNLEELFIHDTKLSLSHLPKVFESCQKVVKFSFSLTDKNLDCYNRKEALLDWLKKGFSKLTHLKIFTFAFNDKDCIDFWPVTFGVLTWCSNCTDLLIEAAYSRPSHDAKFADRDGLYSYKNQVTRLIYQNLFPKLSWMRESLKNLMFIRRGDRFDPDDPFIDEFLGWIVSDEGQQPSLTSFQRLWVQDLVSLSPLYDSHLQSTESVISVDLAEDGFENYGELRHERYRHLLHLGLFEMENFRRLEYLPDLKYVRGHCQDAQGLDEFCQSHHMLEELHFNWDYFSEGDRLYLANNSNWNLQKLQTLVYNCGRPSKEVVDHLTTSCPNIENLHIGLTKKIPNRRYTVFGAMKNANFLSGIRFQHLKFLTFDGFLLFDGSYLDSVIKQCPKLERFHISGTFESRTFLSNLGQSLPLAKKLRDLRLEWDHIESDSDLVDFLKALLKCPLLERLVLDEDCRSHQSHQASSQIENYVFTFVSNMKHLVAFCLSSSRFDDPDAIFERINQRFVEEIIPRRSSFWFHLGKVLPKENEPSVPRIHSDEILHPIEWFDTPPQF